MGLTALILSTFLVLIVRREQLKGGRQNQGGNMLKFIFLEKLQFKIECENVGLLGGEVGCEEDKKKNWGARQEEKL